MSEQNNKKLTKEEIEIRFRELYPDFKITRVDGDLIEAEKVDDVILKVSTGDLFIVRYSYYDTNTYIEKRLKPICRLEFKDTESYLRVDLKIEGRTSEEVLEKLGKALVSLYEDKSCNCSGT